MSRESLRFFGFFLGLIAALGACSSHGSRTFGQPCASSADCVSDFCVGGEVGGSAFCSEDCSGKASGATCGSGKGKCVADFVAWCWLPCATNSDCTSVNALRPICATGSSGGKAYPFPTCYSNPAADATSTASDASGD